MEREGRGEGEMIRGRRGGVEMKKGRRGIVIGGMILGLLMGCNNGGEDPQKVFLKSVVGLGNDFLDVFTSFGEMVGDVLGFNTKTTKKSEVGAYFKNIENSLTKTKTKLEKIVADMKSEKNPNASKTEVVITTLNEKLNQIIDGAKTVNDAIGDDSKSIGDVVNQNGGAAGSGVNSLVKGIKTVVDVVLKGVGNPDAGDDKGPVKDSDGTAGAQRAAGAAGDGDARNLFANNNAGLAAVASKAAKDASKAVAAVTGVDILQAIAIGSEGKAAKLANNTGDANAAIASANNANDATIAGGIALRAMAKGGKFANASDAPKADVAKAVKEAAVSAVTKALNALTIAIRKTIDEGLKSVKEAMNINANDNPVTSETGAAK